MRGKGGRSERDRKGIKGLEGVGNHYLILLKNEKLLESIGKEVGRIWKGGSVKDRGRERGRKEGEIRGLKKRDMNV